MSKREASTGIQPTAWWDAQAALDDGQLCGWADYGRRRGEWDCADLGVLVADRWQRRGIASALSASGTGALYP